MKMKRIVMHALLSISFCTTSTFLQCKSAWQFTKKFASFFLAPPDIVTKEEIYSGTSLWLESKNGIKVLGEAQEKEKNYPLVKRFTLDKYGTLCLPGRTLARWHHTLPGVPLLMLIKYAAVATAAHELYCVAKEGVKLVRAEP